MKSQLSLASVVLLALLSGLLARIASAGSATWNQNATSGDWNDPANWTPATVPNGPNDTATFDVSNITNVSLSATTELNGIAFNPGASAFTITANPTSPLTLGGVGITNNSGVQQEFAAGVNASGDAGAITFSHGASAGGQTKLMSLGGTASGALGGVVALFDDSDAATASLVGVGGTNGGEGGRIEFRDSSTADLARPHLSGNGRLDISQHQGGLTIGSLSGAGLVDLGSETLLVGRNNRNRTFAGVIDDGDSGSGSLTKIGSGKLRLSGANTYGGGTTLVDGALVVNNTTGSGTGTGNVTVLGGYLGGSGVIAGSVTLGTQNTSWLAPGEGGQGTATLTVQGSITFDSNSQYQWRVSTITKEGDTLVANGVTIRGGNSFFGIQLGDGPLPMGKVYIVINNTSSKPIAGVFSNMPEGSGLGFGSHNYSVTYRGGDGNDLALTVVN